MPDRLRLEYVPLSRATLWERNPKPHDLGAIIQSIKRYGFKDPMKFEPKLNGGSGGIVEGNGRTEALAMLFDSGEKPPNGIGVEDSGEWAVPILFGVDAKSEAQAEAYALDHNSLTVMGGDFGPDWQSRLYPNLDELLGVAERLQSEGELPISLDGDDLDSLLKKAIGDPPGGWANPEDGEEADYRCPSCGYEWRGVPR